MAQSDAIAVTGALGDGYLVDTARCHHYGSRGNRLPRLVFMINFARVNCVTEADGDAAFDAMREKLAETFYKDDPARSFGLLAVSAREQTAEAHPEQRQPIKRRTSIAI